MSNARATAIAHASAGSEDEKNALQSAISGQAYLEDPERFPLPDLDLLDLQWTLHRLGAM